MFNFTNFFTLFFCIVSQCTNAEIESNITQQLKSTLDDSLGGATTNEWGMIFLDDSDEECTGCDTCDGSSLASLFYKELGNFCTECDYDTTCTKIRVINKFGDEWPMKYFSMTSSNYSPDEDPSGMKIFANDDGTWLELPMMQKNAKHWDGAPFDSARDSINVYIVKNYYDVDYKDYALDLYLPAILQNTNTGSVKMQVGTYHIDEAYLAKYSQDITQAIYGIACFFPSVVMPTPEMMIGKVIDPTSEYIVAFELYQNSLFTEHAAIVEFKACVFCPFTQYGSRMPSFWSHSEHAPEEIHFISSAPSEDDPTVSTNTFINVPGHKPYVMQSIRVVAIGTNVEYYLNDMDTPAMSFDQDKSTRPPVGDLFVFLGSALAHQYSADNLWVHKLTYTKINRFGLNMTREG